MLLKGSMVMGCVGLGVFWLGSRLDLAGVSRRDGTLKFCRCGRRRGIEVSGVGFLTLLLRYVD